MGEASTDRGDIAAAIDAWRAATAKVLAEVQRILRGEAVDPHDLVALKAELDRARLGCTAAWSAVLPPTTAP